MAKDEKGGKIRVVVVELEGSNETIQEGLRTVANAIGRPIIAVRTPSNSYPQNLIDAQSQVLLSDSDIESDSENTTPANASQPQKAKKARSAPKTPTLLELDLKSGDMSLEAFCQEKKLSSELSKYLAIAFWLKRHRNVDSIGQDHVYTCYRSLKWKMPKDFGQPLRNGKAKDYFRSTDKGLYSITHIGDNKVQEAD